MAVSGAGSEGPICLSSLLDDALRHLQSAPGTASPHDGFLYSGNRHESVPRRLFLDKRLTPLERNAWQIFRLLLNDDGVTAFPTYEQLRPYLTSMPCTTQASHETVARALTVLRLTRWLSLVRRRRNPTTGRIQGNLYVLHDDPLTPYEAISLDPDYLTLVSQTLSHASKAIQRVAHYAIHELTQDPMLMGRTLPTRLQVLAQRMSHGGMEPINTTYPQDESSYKSEEGSTPSLRNENVLASESEAGTNTRKTDPLRNPKQDRTEVHSNRINTVRTVPMARELQHLQLPERFHALKAEQQAGAMAALRQVEAGQRQAVLDEWAARCCRNGVRNPAGYLFGIIQKAIRGEFKAWAGQSEPPVIPPSGFAEPITQPKPTPKTATPEVVETHLSYLHSLFNKL